MNKSQHLNIKLIFTKFTLGFVILFIFFFNCTDKPKIKKTLNFKEIKKYDVVPFELSNQVIIGFPSLMSYTDSTIIVLSYKSLNFITIFDLKNNQVIEAGRRGKGPGELIMPTSLSACNWNEKYFEVYDYAQKKLFLFDIDSCRTKCLDTKPFKAYNIEGMPYKCSALNRNLTISTGIFEDYFHFQICDSAANSVIQFGNFDYNPNDKNKPINKSLAYQGNLSVQVSNLAWACSNAQILETFLIKNDNEIIKKGSLINGFPEYIPENKNSGFSSAVKSENKKGYLDIATTKKFIYLLYSSKTMDKIKSEEVVCSSEIQVFDWACNPIKKINLDKEIFNLTISELDNKIYGLVHDPDPKIISVQL